MSADQHDQRLEALFSGTKRVVPDPDRPAAPPEPTNGEVIRMRLEELEAAVAEARRQAEQERAQRAATALALENIQAELNTLKADVAGWRSQIAQTSPPPPTARRVGQAGTMPAAGAELPPDPITAATLPSIGSRVITTLNWLTQVYHRDPDQARRGRLLSILLLGTGAATIVGMVAGLVFGLAGNLQLVLASGLALLLLVVGLYFLNRSRSPRAAAMIFLIGLVTIISFSDAPSQVIGGRTTITYVLPIVMASVVLAPAASFVFAGLVSAVLLLLSIFNTVVQYVSPVTVVAFMLVALVGWLAARSLENALGDLRTINRELDQRVADRTRDLAEALGRERAEASRSQAILEGIADGVIVFDPAGRAIVANPAIGHLINRPAQQIPGSRLDQLMQNDVDPANRERLLDLMRSGEKSQSSLRLPWGEKTLSVTTAPVRPATGELIGTVAVFRDFTREAEVERMKSAFVSMVSHELRTPMSAILGYTDMLQQEERYGPLSEKQRNLNNRITANTRRLLNMVNDLLDQAQIEAGKLSLQISTFTPTELIESLYHVVDEFARSKGLDLTSQIAPDVPATLSGDPQRLHQIMVNLVNNAIKFTPKGKRVGVRLFRADPAHWGVEVRDAGMGIPPEAQERIFEPFWQVGDAITRSQSGVGLGLSIVKQLVTRMGGEIRLVSEVGRGSTFTLTFPLDMQSEAIA